MSGIRLDWRRGGYFFDAGLLKTSPREWQHWAHILDRAKRGDFTDTPSLLDVFFSTENRLLRDACCQLLGDAGSTEAIRKTAMLLRARFADLDPIGGDDALDLANALAVHGQLLFIPEILLIFEWNLGLSDSRIFALLLSRMLEMEWGPIAQCPRREEEFPEYRDKVRGRTREFALDLGSEQAYVFMGQALNVPGIARLLLRNLGSSHFEEASQWLLRHRFEASTGINCTSFFREDRFQPLTAAVVLEEFLSSSDATQFVPGHKYFFGWPVP
jgi:hypothetical protein